jgi:hypothetical protein
MTEKPWPKIPSEVVAKVPFRLGLRRYTEKHLVTDVLDVAAGDKLRRVVDTLWFNVNGECCRKSRAITKAKDKYGGIIQLARISGFYLDYQDSNSCAPTI